MAYAVKVEGRRFVWFGSRRLTPVRKGFRRWVEVPESEATHTIHAWLPDPMGVWEFTVRDLVRSQV